MGEQQTSTAKLFEFPSCWKSSSRGGQSCSRSCSVSQRAAPHWAGLLEGSVQGAAGTTLCCCRDGGSGQEHCLSAHNMYLKIFFNLIFPPLLIQRLKLNSWKGTEAVPVIPMKQRPSGSQGRPWVRTTLPAPCPVLGPFLPLLEQSIPPGSDQTTPPQEDCCSGNR